MRMSADVSDLAYWSDNMAQFIQSISRISLKTGDEEIKKRG
jgi:hypothetical protein